MKVFLSLCIAAAVQRAGAAPAAVGNSAPVQSYSFDNTTLDRHNASTNANAGGALLTNGDTANWKADHVSTANNSTQDHDSHDHSLENEIVPSHDADTRNNAQLVADLQKHTRHPKLASGSECTSITCAHVQRTYNGKATSSIVVNHICQNKDLTDGSNATNNAWGAQFVSANTNPDCTEETVCTDGHVCGMTASGVCECHAWDFANQNTDFYETMPVAHHDTTYLPVAATEVDGEPSEYFTTPAP